MWIRSQDRKELVDVTGKHIYVWDKSVFIDLWADAEGESGSVTLGEYKSPERALEVMDAIEQGIIAINYSATFTIVNDYCNPIFPMPVE
jgi:hypothetical protein